MIVKLVFQYTEQFSCKDVQTNMIAHLFVIL